jgi:hypothetical protein
MILGTFKRRAVPFLSGERPTFGTVLLSILLKAYGTEVLNWDGATIQMQVRGDFGVDMPRKVYDQLLALITALTTDLVYTDVEIFDEVCNALCRKGLGSYRSIPPALDVAWAVTEIEIADPEPVNRGKDRWDDSIKRYIRVVLNDEGISFAPKSLDFVKSLPPNTHETEDPAIFASSWLSKQEASDEIDIRVEELSNTMLRHLREAGLGAPVTVKMASTPEVVKVDGEKVRDDVNVEFTGGSHSGAIPEIPKDEIWVEKDLSERDQRKIILHEAVEKALMQQGKKLPKAHEVATSVEEKARASSKTAAYDPPMNEAAIRQAGREALLNDPVHAWRAKEGLELIHEEPDSNELERIYANWQLMTAEQKAVSDQKSKELFGLSNSENYNKLRKLYSKTAEWTSPANQAAHVLKHGPEFGSPEAYLAAEAEHAAAPAGDEVARDIRCKIGPDGTPDCTMSYHSPTRGTLHVKRLKDGRTVTLYKITA